MAVVTFDVTAFRAAYPQFTAITDTQLQNFFSTACLFLNNTDNSVVADTTTRAALLNMLVCHLATLSQRGDGSVGQITSASEGGVSASFTALAGTRAAQWYCQTACGAAYWNAIQPYMRGGRYFAYARTH